MKTETVILQQLKNTELFSSSEKMIANAISADPKRFVTLNIREIAKETYTSPTTVMRFCHKICDGGFNTFRIQLAAELKIQNLPSLNTDEESLAKNLVDLDTIVSSLESNFIDSIIQTKTLLNYELIKSTVQCIISARKIHIFGIGATQRVAKDFYFKLLRIDKNVEIHSEFTEQHIQATNANKNDCAFLLSVSGETSYILSIANTLLKNGVPLITVTKVEANPLSKCSNYPLVFKNFENYQNVGNFSAQISMQFVLDIIYFLIFNQDYNTNKNIMQNSNL